MVGDRTKKQKLTENPEEVDAELILSIEKLQEIQDDLEKVPFFFFSYFDSIEAFNLHNYLIHWIRLT